MEARSQKRKLAEIFLFIFILSLIIINWNTISWAFNYKELGGLVSDFFNPYPDTASALIDLNSTTGKITLRDYSGQNYSLQIPSIAVSVPVIIATTTNKSALADDLDKGAVYYPGSVLPGQDGQVVILGHSAPPNWPRVKHDYIFSDIEDLKTGDPIILTFDGSQYMYKVTGKKIIQPGEDVKPSTLSGNILTLISCWPPGENYQRIAVTAELEKI